MNEPRIIPPDEARVLLSQLEGDAVAFGPTLLRRQQMSLAHTAATLGDRLAAVKKLHSGGHWCAVGSERYPVWYEVKPCPTARALGVTSEVGSSAG